MSSSSKKPRGKPLVVRRGNSFLSIVRYVVSAWRTYIGLMSWATIAVLVIFVFTGEIFTRNGLILLLILPLPILLYYLGKWLEKHEEK